MQELLEYFVYNYRMENPILTEHLVALFDSIKDSENVPQDVKTEIFKAMQMSRGYTEYKAGSVAQDLGLTKSRVKTLMKQAVDEHKIEMVVEYNLTFIKPIQLELNWVKETSNIEDSKPTVSDDDSDGIFIMVDDDDEDIIID